MADDGLEFIIEDHERFRERLDRYEELGDDELDAKSTLIGELIEAVVVHSAMEEQAFYPWVMRTLPDLEDDIREEIEEHHIVEVLMAELEALDPANEQFDAKVEVLAENLLHHLQEEEDELFPVLRDRIDHERLVALEDDLRRAREAAPTDPDPERVGA